jgi:hypothetical protein
MVEYHLMVLLDLPELLLQAVLGLLLIIPVDMVVILG